MVLKTQHMLSTDRIVESDKFDVKAYGTRCVCKFPFPSKWSASSLNEKCN